MREIGLKLGLTESSVYKWHWDHTCTMNKRFEKTLAKINYVAAEPKEENFKSLESYPFQSEKSDSFRKEF